MEPLLTAKEMREADRLTIEEFGISGLVLMENAGLAVVDEVEIHLEENPDDFILILCGKGNNGGDGMVAARHLANQGIPISVALIGQSDALKGDARIQYDILQKMKVPVHEIQTLEELEPFSDADCIVDALLGTGIFGPVTGLMGEVIEWINQSGARVIAVDLPSGIQSDTGACAGNCVLADVTVTMAALKRGLAFHPGRDLAGEIVIADISMPDTVFDSFPPAMWLVELEDVQDMLPLRFPNGHKGTYGKIAVLAGSRGMTGAASLVSQATLRAGAGLTILGIPESLNPILETQCAEVMTRPFVETSAGSLSMKALPEIEKLIEWADILILGPGLSMDPDTGELVRHLVQFVELPLVIDADGLNHLAGHVALLKARKSPTILTPHCGELARLLGDSPDTVCNDRLTALDRIVDQTDCVCVLKGSPTLIKGPDDPTYVNSTGNDGLATAGAGDVLTGIIGGFLAQNVDAIEAAIASVYVHGDAADLFASEFSERGLIAGDLLDLLPEILFMIETAE
ncbi:NAD(P)H-hydrate dehydratase [candidate division KSB1 bacterium]|nr:NAD(P)H-hydrate dehydratase [candidate division KSB1 bacterium]